MLSAALTATVAVWPATHSTLQAQVAQPTQVVQATQSTLIDGFAITYGAPAMWTLSKREGRIHAWTDGTKTSALVVYGGHFSSLELSMGDAQRVLGVPREEDIRAITPLGPATFGSYAGLAGSLRVVGQRPVLAHVAAVQLNDSTVLGAVVVLDVSASDSALNSASYSVAALLAGARSAPSLADTALTARITGRWAVSMSSASSPAGGYTNDESWTFGADGAFAYRKRFAVSVPGGNITPEERDDTGRWYAVGGAIVLVSAEGRLTVDVQLDGPKLVLDGTTFTRQ